MHPYNRSCDTYTLRLFTVRGQSVTAKSMRGLSDPGRATSINSFHGSMVLHIVSRCDLLQRGGPSVFPKSHTETGRLLFMCPVKREMAGALQ